MSKERYTFDEVYDMLDGRLPPELRSEQGTHCINEEFRSCLARALTKLPKEIVDWTCDKVIFASSTDKPACCLSRSRMEPAKVIIFFRTVCWISRKESKRSLLLMR